MADDGGIVAIPPPIKGAPNLPTYGTPQSLETVPIPILTSDNVRYEFEVEVARTDKQKQIGMMFRNDVAPQTGMLFLFNDETIRSFWMKNTFVSLDLLFIRRDGVVSHIHENAEPRSLAAIPSNGPAFAVLEIGGGEAKRLELGVGDRLIQPDFFRE